MSELLRGPVTVANLTAAAGVEVTVDGWWPCLNLTWRTPVPASITKITAQVREQGTTSPVAETVMTAVDLAAGTAKVVNGVSVGQHLQVRLSPAGAPGLPFQPTPWLDVTTPWDALIAELDGLKLGCFTIVCGVGVPTRTDLELGSLYVREDVSQLWRYVEGAAAPAAGVNILGTNLKASGGTNVVTLSGYTADQVLRFSKPLVANSGGLLSWDAYSPWPDDSGTVPIASPVAGQTWSNEVAIKGNTGGADTTLFTATLDANLYTTAALAFAALAAQMPVTFTGRTTYKIVGPIDPTPADHRSGLSILVEVLTPGWVLMSDLTSIRANGVEVEDAPRSLDFTGPTVSAATDSVGNVTFTFTHAYSTLTGIPAAIDAIDGLTPAANKFAYYTGASTAALADVSAFALTFLDDASAGAVRTTLDVYSTAQVDGLVAGLSWKQAVRAGTTANITLSGAQTIDGVSVVAGDRVLVKNQSTASQNGLYVAASGAWARSTDADSGAELVNATCYVSEGTTLADTQWTCTTNATITVGSTSLAFAQLATGGGITALTGDVTASGSGSVAAALATVNSNVGTFGDATHVAQLTVNAKGLITAVSSVAITGAGGGSGLWSAILSATPTAAGTGLNGGTLGSSVTATDMAVGVLIAGPGPMAAYTTSVPATPYSITALLTCTQAGVVPALGWTDLTKVHVIYPTPTTGNMAVGKFSTIAAFFNVDYNVARGFYGHAPIWQKIRDDGTNVTFSVSADGVNFYTIFSVAKSAGYLGSSGYSHIMAGSPGGSGAQDVTVMSWTQGS